MGYEHVFVFSLAGVHVHSGPSGRERRRREEGKGGGKEGKKRGWT